MKKSNEAAPIESFEQECRRLKQERKRAGNGVIFHPVRGMEPVVYRKSIVRRGKWFCFTVTRQASPRRWIVSYGCHATRPKLRKLRFREWVFTAPAFLS